MNAQRTLKIIREGGEQRISLPADMQFPGDEVTVTREGDRLVISPKRRKTLEDLLAKWEPIDDEFPDIDDAQPELGAASGTRSA
ncbi:antitoxin [Caenispirillum salinarum]|uniref:antitoxin n=1 Tax=Caenispirillum salinarum TaxID=859058 RepID=UPI00384AC67A